MSPPSFLEIQQLQTKSWIQTLIPKLPNDLSALILAFIPYPHHSRLKSVSKSWKLFFSSKNLSSLRLTHLPISRKSNLICIFPEDPSITSPYLFDPFQLAWCSIPPMPCNPHVYGLCNFKAVCIGQRLYVLGGSLFDTRSFPLDRPCPTNDVFRFDFVSLVWERMASMITPRGSFACAGIGGEEKIVVAGGGSRHRMFGAAGSRMSSVEMYDVRKDEWVGLDGLPRFRAGCVGFFVGSEREFWVMGGYGESRTISGVFPVDEYYRDAVVMDLNGGKWREVGNMWEVGDRRHFGKIVVVEGEGWDIPGVYMLDRNDIFRYDMDVNRWSKETSVPRKATDDSAVGCVALNGELHVMTNLNAIDFAEGRRARNNNRSTALFLQIYHPIKKSWRSIVTKPPRPLDLKNAVLCQVQV